MISTKARKGLIARAYGKVRIALFLLRTRANSDVCNANDIGTRESFVRCATSLRHGKRNLLLFSSAVAAALEVQKMMWKIPRGFRGDKSGMVQSSTSNRGCKAAGKSESWHGGMQVGTLAAASKGKSWSL